MRGLVVLPMVATLALAGCASSSGNITASYVSPLQYQSYNCDQIAQEAQRVSAKVVELSGVQDQNATNDAVKTTLAVVIFPLIALANSGNGQNAAQLGELKGQFDGLQQASIQKNCNIKFQQAPAKKT